MKKLLPDILAALNAGERVAIAVVLDSCGSAPRKSCSAMAVFESGRSAGSIGGGALEFKVQRVLCDELFSSADKLTKIEGYTLLPDGKGDLHMICGGDVTIFSKILLPSPEITDVFERAVNDSGDKWLCIETQADGAVFLTDGDAEHFALLSRPNYDSEGNRLTYPLNPSGFVYIFGGGHVGRALAGTLARIDFDCVVFDSREKYSNPAEHPMAVRTIHGDYTDIERHVKLTAADYVIVVTHGHMFDYEVLAQTLASKAKYVGCMGSRRKTAAILERLRSETDISEKDIERLHAPIGLKIGAETPQELAISIAAQLIAFRASQ